MKNIHAPFWFTVKNKVIYHLSTDTQITTKTNLLQAVQLFLTPSSCLLQMVQLLHLDSVCFLAIPF